jgi:hypothetical protein
LQWAGGLLVAWLIFSFFGRVLTEIPDDFHEGTYWQFLARKSHALSRHEISGPWQNRALIVENEPPASGNLSPARYTRQTSQTLHSPALFCSRGAVLLSSRHTVHLPASNSAGSHPRHEICRLGGLGQ